MGERKFNSKQGNHPGNAGAQHKRRGPAGKLARQLRALAREEAKREETEE